MLAHEITEPITDVPTQGMHKIHHIPPDRVEKLKGDTARQVKTWVPLNVDVISMATHSSR